MEVGLKVFKDGKDSLGDGTVSLSEFGGSFSGGFSFTFLVFFFLLVGEGQESLNLVVGEEVAVGLELLGDGLDVVLGHFSELEGISGDNVTSDVLLEESDDVEGLCVLLDGSDEELVAVALVVEEDFRLSGDLILSKFVPGDVVLGLSELLLEAGSVFLSLGPELLVKVHDLGEFSDGSGSDEFVGGVLLVRSVLGINIGLLEVTEESEDCIDGITSLGSSLEESKNLILGGGGHCG
jgi:hypothetical protein